MEFSPSQELLYARRRLEELPFIELLDDIQWYGSISQWIIHCTITIDQGSSFIPNRTEWYVHISNEYPLGSIEFHPSKNNGITCTFPHQSYNILENPNDLWRSGKICCRSPFRVYGRRLVDIEPSSYEERLKWNFERAHKWLISAVEGTLLRNDDPFEIPSIPYSNSLQLVYSESTETFQFWQKNNTKYGITRLYEFQNILFCDFCSVRNEVLFRDNYGLAISRNRKFINIGIWILLPSCPVNEPYNFPTTWEELNNCSHTQGFKLKEIIKYLLPKIRDGKKHLLLIGFPIPEIVGGPNKIIYWSSLLLPVLSNGIINGYRSNEKSYLMRDFAQVLNDSMRLEWCKTSNWNNEAILSRGRYPSQIVNTKIVVIGAGAIGSIVSELFIRSGIRNMLIIEYDNFEIGNLTRHTLDIKSLKKSKSEQLSDHLNLINPNAHVISINKCIEIALKEDISVINDYDIIIDCTGEDFVIKTLSDIEFLSSKILMSISIGFFAKRLYLYTQKGVSFDGVDFHNKLAEWLNKDMHEFSDTEMPMEGIGCWHPVFPARADDLWLLVSSASKYISSLDMNNIPHELIVYEQIYEDNIYKGVKRVQ